eukprot:11768020-Ditylum_brightwellii.AAC.1
MGECWVPEGIHEEIITEIENDFRYKTNVVGMGEDPKRRQSTAMVILQTMAMQAATILPLVWRIEEAEVVDVVTTLPERAPIVSWLKLINNDSFVEGKLVLGEQQVVIDSVFDGDVAQLVDGALVLNPEG